MIMQGDCLDVMPTLDSGSVDLILCDLPYGQTKAVWDKKVDMDRLWEQYRRLLAPHGNIVLFGQGRFTGELMVAAGKWWRYNLIWEKTNATGFLNANKMPMRAHEDIVICSRPGSRGRYQVVKTQGHARKVVKGRMGPAEVYGQYGSAGYDSTERHPRSVIRVGSDKQKGATHGTQKPLELLRRLVRMYGLPGGLCLDNCAGSGSTGVACKHEGMRFVGIELR